MRTRCAAVGWLLLGAVIALGTAARAAEPDRDSRPDAASVFQQAIKNAEADLEREEGHAVRSPGGWGVSEYLGLAALAAALGLALWATRWTRGLFSRPVSGRGMRILDRMAVSRNTTLVLVRMRGRDYWLADHPHGVAVLAEWRVEDPPAAHSASTAAAVSPARHPDQEGGLGA